MGWNPSTWFQNRNKNDSDPYEAGRVEREEGEWGPGGQKSASEQIDLYEKSNKRQGVKNFLGDYGKKLAENLEADERNRSSNTENAQSGSSSSKDRDERIQSQIASLGDDISIQEGLKASEDMIPGTPGRKGILGTVVKTGLKLAFPVAGTIGSAAIGDRLDHV